MGRPWDRRICVSSGRAMSAWGTRQASVEPRGSFACGPHRAAASEVESPAAAIRSAFRPYSPARERRRGGRSHHAEALGRERFRRNAGGPRLLEEEVYGGGAGEEDPAEFRKPAERVPHRARILRGSETDDRNGDHPGAELAEAPDRTTHARGPPLPSPPRTSSSTSLPPRPSKVLRQLPADLLRPLAGPGQHTADAPLSVDGGEDADDPQRPRGIPATPGPRPAPRERPGIRRAARPGKPAPR